MMQQPMMQWPMMQGPMMQRPMMQRPMAAAPMMAAQSYPQSYAQTIVTPMVINPPVQAMPAVTSMGVPVETYAHVQQVTAAPKTLTYDLEVHVTHGDDDCEERLTTGKTSLHDEDLDLREGRAVGLMFLNLDIDQGAQIGSAEIQFQSRLQKEDYCQMEICADANGGATRPFDQNLPSQLANRPRTQGVAWTPGPWAPETPQSTPDLAAIVQDIVNAPNWRRGCNITFILFGLKGQRVAWAFDGQPAKAPMLRVTCTIPEDNAPMDPMVHQGYDAHGHMKVPPPPPPPQEMMIPAEPVPPPAPEVEAVLELAPPAPDQQAHGPPGNPWSMEAYSHENQNHTAPTIHQQPAHLIYEDKFRYARYNLSHENLKPTKLDRQYTFAKATPGYEGEAALDTRVPNSVLDPDHATAMHNLANKPYVPPSAPYATPAITPVAQQVLHVQTVTAPAPRLMSAPVPQTRAVYLQ